MNVKTLSLEPGVYRRLKNLKIIEKRIVRDYSQLVILIMNSFEDKIDEIFPKEKK